MKQSKDFVQVLLMGSFLLFALAGCRQVCPIEPVPQSTSQMARLQEWLVIRGAVDRQYPVDSLRNLKLDDGYHTIYYAWSSQFTYDDQERLMAEYMTGYRDSGDYGLEKKDVVYQYTYQPGELVATQTISFRKADGGVGQSIRNTQRLPLNEQGRVVAAPSLVGLGYPGQYAMSKLLRDAVLPFANDVLRTYDGDGILTKTQSDYVPIQPELFRTVWVQQADKGNITGAEIQHLDKNLLSTPTAEPTLVESIRYTYNLARPGLRNPYQFLGVANRNLVVQSVRTISAGITTQTDDYQYEFDGKVRVKRYFITSGTYLTVGLVEYTNP